MSSSNVDKIYAEHPFLQKILPRVKVKSAKVKRWNEVFFQLSSIDWLAYPGHRATAKFFLLDDHGEIVARVGESWVPFWTRDENAGQALARLGEKSKIVKYAVYLGKGMILFKR